MPYSGLSSQRSGADRVDVGAGHPLDHGLQPSRVAVDANLGTVILQGELDSPDDVQLAQNVAASVPGVLSVENRLCVRGALGRNP